jgi:hypothetical protein
VVVTGYEVGDVLDLPPEPPIGTHTDGRDGAGRIVKLRRWGDGWQIGRSSRRFPWRTVAELWFPLTITELPDED